MGSAKQHAHTSTVLALFREWDKGSKLVRSQILQDFISQNLNKTGPELEAEFAQAASLFLARLTAWYRLTYMIGTCLTEQLQALQIFISASSGHKFMSEFMEVGGVLTSLEILGLKQAKEIDKTEALRLLTYVADAGRKHKELICESYGIRSIAECLAKAQDEETQEHARHLLQLLSQGNPKFEVQVYKGLIALLPCNSPRAQQMAAQTLRVVQSVVKSALPVIVDPLLNLLRTLHLEVQYEAIELIKLLMDYEVQEAMLWGLVKLLRPDKDDIVKHPEILDDPTVSRIARPLPLFVQQAAAAKCIGILCRESNDLADKLIQIRVVHNLMFVMGNQEYADSQRQASISLEYLCRSYPIVDEHVRQAMGELLYEQFIVNAESLYTTMTAVQAEVLISNKLNIPDMECVD